MKITLSLLLSSKLFQLRFVVENLVPAVLFSLLYCILLLCKECNRRKKFTIMILYIRQALFLFTFSLYISLLKLKTHCWRLRLYILCCLHDFFLGTFNIDPTQYLLLNWMLQPSVQRTQCLMVNPYLSLYQMPESPCFFYFPVVILQFQI